MTKIKLCGLSRQEDIMMANRILPDYIGFVFAQKSRRYVPPDKARALKSCLAPCIPAVGVFVNKDPAHVAQLLNSGVIELAQLHGSEDEEYIQVLRGLTEKQIIQAFRIKDEKDLAAAEKSPADYVLLDSGAGSGKIFDWNLICNFNRPYFLAGGLDIHNAVEAIRLLHPFAVDVSSGIETDGMKDPVKMDAFVTAVRKENIL